MKYQFKNRLKLLLTMLLVVFGVMFSCRQHAQKEANSDALDKDSLSEGVDIEKDLDVDHVKIRPILIPNVPYRISDDEDKVSMIFNRNWLELYRKSDGYYIASVDSRIAKDDEEPCSGLPTEKIESLRNSLLLFDMKELQIGKVDTIVLPEDRVILPTRSITFIHKRNTYTITAKGEKFENLAFAYDKRNVGDYRLLLQVNQDKEVPLIIQSEYNDTETELLFVGDLDLDGLLDFIFSSPRHYEEKRYVVLLSSKQYKSEEEVFGFDC